MYTYKLLVNTKYFPEIVKRDYKKYVSYIVDYADYSSTILEQLGKYRYRKIGKCVLGQANDKKLQSLLQKRADNRVFFCNNKCLSISSKTYWDAMNHPTDYAVVLFKCYQ